jgi:hypothetical protein
MRLSLLNQLFRFESASNGMTSGFDSFKIKAFTALKIPLLFVLNPKILLLNDKECKVKVPLNFITKNHEGCMYFGALTMGADLSGGLLAIQNFQGKNVHFLFKDINGQFLKRCENDAIFYCTNGEQIKEGIRMALESKKRNHIPLHIDVFEKEILEDMLRAKFVLTLSVKVKE